MITQLLDSHQEPTDEADLSESERATLTGLRATGCRWVLRCVAHGELTGRNTMQKAKTERPYPTEWCPVCAGARRRGKAATEGQRYRIQLANKELVALDREALERVAKRLEVYEDAAGCCLLMCEQHKRRLGRIR